MSEPIIPEEILEAKIRELEGQPQSAAVPISAVVRMLKSLHMKISENLKLDPARIPKVRRVYKGRANKTSVGTRAAILADLETGITQREIAARHGVSISLVSAIRCRDR